MPMATYHRMAISSDDLQAAQQFAESLQLRENKKFVYVEAHLLDDHDLVLNQCLAAASETIGAVIVLFHVRGW